MLDVSSPQNMTTPMATVTSMEPVDATASKVIAVTPRPRYATMLNRLKFPHCHTDFQKAKTNMAYALIMRFSKVTPLGLDMTCYQ